MYAEWWNGFSCIQQQKKENKINNKGRAGMETVSPQLQGSTGSKEEAGGNSVGGCITTEHKIDLNMGKPGHNMHFWFIAPQIVLINYW